MSNLPRMLFNFMLHFQQKSSEEMMKLLEAGIEQSKAYQTALNGVAKYINDFTLPSWNAFKAFIEIERDKLIHLSSEQVVSDYLQLVRLNLQPESECALHTRFGDGYRGPVRFHLDLEETFEKQ